ncbi:hypothetical protein B566_EDAN004667 [Ephemera danica]|nr:hypothetical protein B566_EDAN004667 [Ephemera danica]
MITKHLFSTPKPRSSVGKDVTASARWRRERRPCPLVSSSSNVPNRPIARPTPRSAQPTAAQDMAPLDMSTRRKETSALTPHSDPVIDEHFRRSLGRDYLALFPSSASHSSPRNSSPPPAPARPSSGLAPALPGNHVTLTGLSVDDHFAKALGETWLRLQAGEKKAEEKSKTKSTPSSPASEEPSPTTVIPLRVST